MKSIISRIRTRLFTVCAKMRGANIGSDSVMHYSCDIQRMKGIELKDNVTLYKEITVYNAQQGMLVIDSNSHIGAYCYFLIDKNRIRIGKHVAVGPHCKFFCHSNAIAPDKELFTESYIDKDIRIGDNVFIGADCVILPGTIVDDNIVIGARSLVKGKLESGYVYAGSPARKIKKIRETND